jgi:hypothetical protein
MTRTPQEVVDTFVFRDGLIQAETVHYTLRRKARQEG